MTIDALRTPEDRFSLMPGFPYTPHYTETLPGYDGLRMAYIDEGSPDAPYTFLCLHGEPTWSYLYRKMIPTFTDAGHRVVAPDLFGFGRSDKPVNDSDYTFHFHRNSLLALITQLDLRNIILVCQDWGGILGLTLPMDMTDRFKGAIVMNTGLPIGAPPSDGFLLWKGFCAAAPEIPISGLIIGDAGNANMFDALAYDAPFPDNRYKAGVRRFPQLVPIEPGMAGVEECRRARAFFEQDWDGMSFVAVGMQDIVLGEDVMTELHGLFKNAPPLMKIAEGGHFVQEHGEQIAKAALDHFGI